MRIILSFCVCRFAYGCAAVVISVCLCLCFCVCFCVFICVSVFGSVFGAALVSRLPVCMCVLCLSVCKYSLWLMLCVLVSVYIDLLRL